MALYLYVYLVYVKLKEPEIKLSWRKKNFGKKKLLQ